MKEFTDTEKLIQKARSGNNEAKNRFYDRLNERFLPVIKCELKRYAILQKGIPDIEKTNVDICCKAIDEIKKICPIDGRNWSLKRAVHVLHNITDDYIVNTLVPLAKNGDAEAENLLFVLIRNKLLQWMERKSWKTSK